MVGIGHEFYGNSSSTIPFRSLEILEFENMEGWEDWECKDISGVFPGLQKLRIINCPRLKEQLPEQLPSLRSVHIQNCKQLMASVPHATAIHQLTLVECGILQLEYIASTLESLTIGGSHMDRSLLENIEHTMANSCLKMLRIDHCLNMEFPIHHCHEFLINIYIENSCESLKIFPLDFFPKLQRLTLSRCSNLEMISVSEGHDHYVTSITSLNIRHCPKFVSFPKGGLSAPKLEWCSIIDLENLKSLPEKMDILLPSLRVLVLNDCPQLELVPEGGLPSNLKNLGIYNCPKLVASRMKWGLHTHSSLVTMFIEDANMESFPEEGLLPRSLIELSLGFCSNLRKLDYKGLCHLSSSKTLTLEWCPRLECLPSNLKKLGIYNCPRLECLPKEGLPSSLSALEIYNCPLLKKRCQKQKGEDWGKIAHIPHNIR